MISCDGGIVDLAILVVGRDYTVKDVVKLQGGQSVVGKWPVGLSNKNKGWR